MPLTVNVGLSRKSSENFQSKGVSINLSAELDHTLLSDVGRLQGEISALYTQAETAISDQLNHKPPRKQIPSTSIEVSKASDAPARLATASQLRALNAIADRHGIELRGEVAQKFGCTVKQLTLRQASEFIDALKARGQPNGRRRS